MYDDRGIEKEFVTNCYSDVGLAKIAIEQEQDWRSRGHLVDLEFGVDNDSEAVCRSRRGS